MQPGDTGTTPGEPPVNPAVPSPSGPPAPPPGPPLFRPPGPPAFGPPGPPVFGPPGPPPLSGPPVFGAGFRPVPPARVPGPPIRLRRWHVLALVAVVVVAFGAVGGYLWLDWTGVRGSAPVLAGAAADALSGEKAVKLSYTAAGGDGSQAAGSLVVTSGEYASGTISDGGLGTAVLRSTPGGSAVFGDKNWWATRAPDHIAQAYGRWVRPDSGVAFPVDVPSALNPKALATLVRAIAKHGRVAKGSTVDDGKRVITITSGSWRLLLTANSPRRVVSLAGPVDAGGLTPSASLGTRTRVVPVDLDDGSTRQVQDDSGGEYLSMDPSAASSTDASKAQSDASSTLSGQAAPPTGAGAPSPTPSAGAAPSGSGPPAVSSMPVGRPNFTATANANDCSTPTCSWSATVTNDGNAAGTAIVTVSVVPGMAPQTFNLGAIPAGGSKSTPRLSYPNQAPEPEPGQTTSQVSVSYQVDVYCAELDGTDQKKYSALKKRGLDPDKSSAIQNINDPEFKTGAVDMAYQMLQSGAKPQAVESGLENAESRGALPALEAMSEAGNRFQGWDQVAKKLALPDSNWANEAPVLRLAGQLLTQYPDATVLLDTPTDVNGKPSTDKTAQRVNSDVLVTSPSVKDAYQVKTVTNRGVESNINGAVKQLNGKKGAGSGGVVDNAANGYQKIAIIYPQPGSLDYDQDPAAIMARLKGNPDNLDFCKDPTLGLDKLVIVNAKGRHEWTGDWLRANVCE